MFHFCYLSPGFPSRSDNKPSCMELKPAVTTLTSFYILHEPKKKRWGYEDNNFCLTHKKKFTMKLLFMYDLTWSYSLSTNQSRFPCCRDNRLWFFLQNLKTTCR